MAHKKKIAYWLLLLTALYLASAVLSVGESQARYVNTATWYTVAEPTQNKVTSDCLELTTQPPLTVLLGQLESEPREISFTLGSSADTSGVLTWQVDHPEYLDVRLQLGENSLSSGATVSLTGETPTVVTMRLTPTAKALEPRDGMHVNIQVRFGESLAGTFQVELLPVAQPEPTEPETTEPETTEPETTEPETTEPETTEPETTEPEPPSRKPPSRKPPSRKPQNPRQPSCWRVSKPITRRAGFLCRSSPMAIQRHPCAWYPERMFKTSPGEPVSAWIKAQAGLCFIRRARFRWM